LDPSLAHLQAALRLAKDIETVELSAEDRKRLIQESEAAIDAWRQAPGKDGK